MWYHHKIDITWWILLSVEILFMEESYDCILFHPIKCFNILMKIPYLRGTFIHSISKYEFCAVPRDKNLSWFWLAMAGLKKAFFFILICWRIFVICFFAQITLIILIYRGKHEIQPSQHHILILTFSKRSLHIYRFELPIFCHFS